MKTEVTSSLGEDKERILKVTIDVVCLAKTTNKGLNSVRVYQKQRTYFTISLL